MLGHRHAILRRKDAVCLGLNRMEMLRVENGMRAGENGVWGWNRGDLDGKTGAGEGGHGWKTRFDLSALIVRHGDETIWNSPIRRKE